MKNSTNNLDEKCLNFFNSILNNAFTPDYIQKINNEYTFFEMVEYIEKIMNTLKTKEQKNKVEKIWNKLLYELNKNNFSKKNESILLSYNYLEDKSISKDSISQYLKEINQYPKLTKKELFDILEHYKKYGDDESREIIINCNLRLVVFFAKFFWHRGIDYLDLIQEGNMGLMNAIEKFDPLKGYEFSTYASWWITRKFKNWLSNKNQLIRIPLYRKDNIKKLSTFIENWLMENHVEPTNEQIMQNLNWTMNEVKNNKKIIQLQHTISLNTYIDDKKDATLEYFIEDENIEDTESIALKLIKKSTIEEVIKTLTPREEKVLRLRFGLDNDKPMTFDDIRYEFNVTRERIRQIYAKALKKLNHPTRARILKDFLD